MSKANVFEGKLIVLKSVYDKAGIKYMIQPCKDKFGRLPSSVKRVKDWKDPDSEMIMSEAERNAYSEGKVIYFPENKFFEVYHGKTYDLNRLEDAAEWEAIKNCPLIAQSRDAKDENGNLIIDGAKSSPGKPSRNGIAELYIDRPGLDTQRRVSKIQLRHKAEEFILNDTLEGQSLKARVLGKDMRNQPATDIVDYLYTIAEKNPNRIIDLYSGDEMEQRILFMDARDKKVIYCKNKLYLYADNVVLGPTDDSVIQWMRDAKNARILELIKRDTYPEMFIQEDSKK